MASKNTAPPAASDVDTKSTLLGSFSLKDGKPTTTDKSATHASLNVDLINSINKGIERLDCGKGLEYMTDMNVLTAWLKEHDMLDKIDQVAYMGTTIMSRAGVLSELCEFKPYGWTVHPILVSKKGNVIQLVSSSPGDTIIGDVAEMQLKLGERENENDSFTKRRELIYDVRQRRIDESCRLIVTKETDSKYDSAPVSIKCRERRALDRRWLNSRLMKQFAMAFLADEKQNVVASRMNATTVDKVLYWEDVSLLDTNGSYDRCQKLMNDFCIWLSKQNTPEGDESSSYEKPALPEQPKLSDPIVLAEDPLFTIVCEEGRKVPANLSVYNAHIIYMDTFNAIRKNSKDADQLKNRIEISLTKVLFLTSKQMFESITDKDGSWACYDDKDPKARILDALPVDYEVQPPPDLAFTPWKKIVLNAPFDTKNAFNQCQIKIENTSDRIVGWKLVVLPKSAAHIVASAQSAILKPKGISLVTVTCKPFTYDPQNDTAHRIKFEWTYAPTGQYWKWRVDAKKTIVIDYNV